MKRLLISFSGGETSAYMTQWLLRQSLYDEIVVVFANTGQENEATLEFVRRCDEHFGFATRWIEARQFPGERRSPSFKEVTFATASRDGAPFEAAIQKYGIPNYKFKDCTRNLKRKPIEAFAASLDWGKEYDLAIGIRVDEIDRQASDRTRSLIYPLISPHPRTKPQINSWWAAQPFRLQLKGYQGNCKWCWKKSFRKHMTIMRENPEAYDFPRRMEETYGKVGPEFLKDPALQREPITAEYRRTFFRGNLSVDDLRIRLSLLRDETFVPASDDAQVFDEALDVGAGCEESCEVFSDEDEKSLEPAE